jgi:hypothetical protein
MNSSSITATAVPHSIPLRIDADQSFWMIALFSSLGLAVSACVLTLGGDLGAAFLY